MIRRDAEHDPQVFADVIDINLTGTMRVAVAARPKLAASRGCVVNLGHCQLTGLWPERGGWAKLAA